MPYDFVDDQATSIGIKPSLLRTSIKSVVHYMVSAGYNKLSSVDNPKTSTRTAEGKDK